MESLVKKGLVKNIATSNMTVKKLKELLKVCKIKPVANEFEAHPCFQQQKMVDFHIKNDILPITYCPIGSPSRPALDRTDDDEVDIEEPAIQRIAKRLGIHPATVCVKWAA
jgi:alcohol dehydrogenase (NADP+)